MQSERERPQARPGLQIGDVLVDRGIVWCRTDRPARLLVERSYWADFGDAVKIRGPMATEAHDFVARVDLEGLAADRTVFVRALFEDPAGRTRSAPLEGRFRTAPSSRRHIRFLWSGDTAGQGFGINPDWGGMRTYEAMRQAQPDFFVHCGDTIYADGPIAAAMPLADGGVWRNVVTEQTSKVAETLDEFRGRYRYNLLDAHVQRFSAEVPQIWLWDDHEVLNNWSAATDLSRDARYTEKDVRRLAARGRQAFLEYAPMRQQDAGGTARIHRRIPYGPLLDVLLLDERSYRAANSHNRQPQAGCETAFMGSRQIAWLKQALRESTALWKVIASDMPIGLLVPGARDAERRRTFDGVANGDGPALGRELELADLLRFIKRERIRNVVWVTADVHYTAAHHYDPGRARFGDFDPFWEFVSGPLNAGTFGPGELDDTFGPRVVFQKGSSAPNAPPSAGLQFFGQVDIDGPTGEMVVTLKDVEGRSLFAQRLAPISQSS